MIILDLTELNITYYLKLSSPTSFYLFNVATRKFCIICGLYSISIRQHCSRSLESTPFQLKPLIWNLKLNLFYNLVKSKSVRSLKISAFDFGVKIFRIA